MSDYIPSATDQEVKTKISLTAGNISESIIFALPGSAEYKSLSRHITTIFQKTYGASIYVTYPLLMGFMDSDKLPIAALGVRRADDNIQLFLEGYLDQSAETYIMEITGQSIPRHAIAEAGNLASAGKNNLLMLLYGLAFYLDNMGISYIIFTGTLFLERYLHSLNLYPHILADAKPERLDGDAAVWGTYYDTHPKVMVGNVKIFRTGLEAYFANPNRVKQ
jgi:hypothetical protein